MAVNQLSERLKAVRARIDRATDQAGRPLGSVRLLPVSKTHPTSELALAVEAGAVRFGENRVQEMVTKDAELRTLGIEPQWAVIGPLQTNKVKYVAELASEFQALESTRVAEALQRCLDRLGRRLDVLIEVNTSGEPAKHGVDPAALFTLARSLRGLDALNVRGLMTVAARTPDRAVVAACFDRLVELRDRLRDEAVLDSPLDELSMGMSGDFELAIARGSTVVRVGSAIFGPRSYT